MSEFVFFDGEDELDPQFKQVSGIEGKAQKGNESERNRGERPDAGIGKCDSHCT